MNTTVTILPGIKSISWLDCEKLQPRVDMQGLNNVPYPVPVMTELHNIDFFTDAEGSCKTEPGDVSSYQSAKLTFRSDSLLPIHRHLGFVIEDANGKHWLIGCKEPPYPKISIEMKFGQPENDPAGFTYEITHNAIKTMLHCII